MMIDSKKNIAVNKVVAIYSRLEPKDYVDLYFLLKNGEYQITDLLKLGQQKDGGLEPFQWAKVIADVDTFSVLPKMIVPCELSELKNFFHRLRNEVIDSCKPSR